MEVSINEIKEKIYSIAVFINRLNIKRVDKLILFKNLLELKLKILTLLEKNKTIKTKPIKQKNNSLKTNSKYGLILNFIKSKGNKVGTDDLKDLKIPGRTLRRYLKKLKDEKRILVEKIGKKHFYKLNNF